jgi:hypothetical protein
MLRSMSAAAQTNAVDLRDRRPAAVVLACFESIAENASRCAPGASHVVLSARAGLGDGDAQPRGASGL